MDAITLLNKHIDVAKLLEHYDFDNVKMDGNMIRSSCKIHGGNNTTGFVVNPESGLWYCHTGDCGGGDAYTLVQRLEDCSFKDAVNKVSVLFDVNIQELEIIERKEAYVSELKQFIKTMKSRKKKSIEEFSIDEPIKEVTKFRSFKEETLRYFELGFVESVELKKRTGDTYILRNRLVFPIKQNGVQIGMSFRRVKPNDYPKWSHQPVSIETKEILYNYDNAIGQGTIVVVEGMPDVWAYHEIGMVAVATFGAHLTEEQYRLLMRTGADIVWSYDGDEAGRNATKKAIQMFMYKANQSCVIFNEGEDPDNISREELYERFTSRKRI